MEKSHKLGSPIIRNEKQRNQKNQEINPHQDAIEAISVAQSEAMLSAHLRTLALEKVKILKLYSAFTELLNSGKDEELVEDQADSLMQEMEGLANDAGMHLQAIRDYHTKIHAEERI